MIDRRSLLRYAGLIPALAAAPGLVGVADDAKADYTLRIATGLVDLSPEHLVSTTLYNGQFPGPLLRMMEGRRVVVDVVNDTDTPELVHWHGQMIPSDVDGAAEEGSPFVPAHGKSRIAFVPKPSGFRFYHTHVVAGADLNRGTYTGQAGPLYIEPMSNPGAYDREIFLVLKEFGPSFSRGGDMDVEGLAGAPVAALKERGKAADAAAPVKTKGFEVGYDFFSINGRMLGHGEPVRVKAGERVLFHVLNASATEIRSLALPGHLFRVVALDGNPVPRPAEVPVLWLGTAERVSALVEMTHPGVWVMGDLADDDRRHGMGTVVEYAGAKGKPRWAKPKPFRWDYARFGNATPASAAPDETIAIEIVKHNAALARIQSMDAERRGLFDGDDEAGLFASSGAPLSAQIPQRQRRHSPAPSPPAQLRIDADRGKADRGRHQGRGHARRLPRTRIRFRRRQSRHDALPLSPAAAYGFRLHGALPLCLAGHAMGDGGTRSVSRFADTPREMIYRFCRFLIEVLTGQPQHRRPRGWLRSGARRRH